MTSEKQRCKLQQALSFAIAVPVSWWVGRMGIAKLQIHRMPRAESTGRHAHWLDYDPRSMRSWAMTPMAITLGLQAQDPGEAAWRVPHTLTTSWVDGSGRGSREAYRKPSEPRRMRCPPGSLKKDRSKSGAISGQSIP